MIETRQNINQQNNSPSNSDKTNNLPVLVAESVQSKNNQAQVPFIDRISQNYRQMKSNYDEKKQKKKQLMYTIPQAKVYPSKPHQLQPEQLKKLDFASLSSEQINMLEDLSTFTPHRQFVKMMTNRHTDIKKKQHFIKEHSSILSSDEFGDFNRAKFEYEKNTRTFAAFCTGSLTLGGFMIGLWVLPARKTPWKYSLIGSVLGLGVSYGFWRMQVYQYHNRMNQQFKSIMKDKYQSQKKTQKLKANQLA